LRFLYIPLPESSAIFLRNGLLIFNGKENKEAGAISFEIMIPRKKKMNYYAKSHQKFTEVISLWKKQNIF
jgi:hypothetical protein